MSLQQRVHGSGRRDPEILKNLQTRICWLWTAVCLDSLFPSERKTGYTNNLLCQKRVYEAKCNNVCNVIRDLWRKRDSGSVSTNTCPSQPENAGKQVAGKTDPSGKVPLPATVCILKSPSPASLTKMIEAFSLVHFLKCIYFQWRRFSAQLPPAVCFSSLLYATSAPCQNEISHWLIETAKDNSSVPN